MVLVFQRLLIEQILLVFDGLGGGLLQLDDRALLVLRHDSDVSRQRTVQGSTDAYVQHACAQNEQSAGERIGRGQGLN